MMLQASLMCSIEILPSNVDVNVHPTKHEVSGILYSWKKVGKICVLFI